MPDQTQPDAVSGRPSMGEAIARAEAALAVRAQGTSNTDEGETTPTRPAKGRGKGSHVQRPMFWRILFLYGGSAAVIIYAAGQMRTGW